MAQVNQLVANAKELGGSSETPLSELLTTCLTARYVVELGRLTAKTEGNGGCELEVLHKLCRDVLALRRLDLAAQRLRIEREAADREMRADEEERKEKLLQAEQDHRDWKKRRQWVREAGMHVPFDPSVDDPADMRTESPAEALKRQTDKLAALHAKLVKDFKRGEEIDREMEEYEQAEEERLAREAEAAAAVAAGQPVGAQEEPVGGSQSAVPREESAKAVAKDAGKTKA